MAFTRGIQLHKRFSVGDTVPMPVSSSDSPMIDAFGRIRISSPTTLFDSKQLYDSQPMYWDDIEYDGAGTSSNHNPLRASTLIGVSDSTFGSRIRQTYRRFNYQPGKSQLGVFTFIFGSGQVGITRQVGLFDDDNGIFLEQQDGELSICIRSSVEGIPVTRVVKQSDWNQDKFNGLGPSKLKLDITKAQIAFIDFEWLGVGRVRFGFVINGLIYDAHEFNHANNISSVYMSTPNLPIRYAIYNDGTGPAATLEHICCSVVSEGGYDSVGFDRSASLGVDTVKAATGGTEYAVLGIRLKNRGITVDLKDVHMVVTTNQYCLWQLKISPTINDTFTFNDVTGSNVQVALGTTANPSTNTVADGTIIASGYVERSGTEKLPLNTAFKLGTSILGTAQTLVLTVTPFTNSAQVSGGISWIEE